MFLFYLFLELQYESRMSVIGVPLKVLHEAEDNINSQMASVTMTFRDGRVAQLEHIYIRGSKIRFMILPDMLKNAPMLKNMASRGRGGGGARGKSAILGAQAGAGGRGRGRGGDRGGRGGGFGDRGGRGGRGGDRGGRGGGFGDRGGR